MQATSAPWPIHPSLREAWGDLYLNSRTATPFQSPDWVTSWWEVFGFGKEPKLLTIYEGGELVAVYPLYRTFAPWRAIRVMGTGVSDYLGPLVRTGFEQPAAEALKAALDELRKVDLVDLQQLRQSSDLAQSLELGNAASEASCPVLRLPNDFESYVASLSKSLRYDVRKGLQGSVSVATAQTSSEALEFLQIFLDLHAARWRKRGLPGAFGMPGVKRFHRLFVSRAVSTGVLRLSVAFSSEGLAIGALYAMRGGRATYFYQSGFAPEARALGPGTILIAHTIRQAIADGCEEFDFLRGDEPYKMRWNPQRIEPNVRYLQSTGAWRGRVGQAVNRAEARVEARIRARLEGKGLLK